MKKPTLKQWMKHAEKYVFDPKTKTEFVKPKSLEKGITMLHITSSLGIGRKAKTKLNPIVTVRIPLTKKELTSYMGKPCKTYVDGCPTCDAWTQWRLLMECVDIKVYRNELVALLLAGRL